MPNIRAPVLNYKISTSFTTARFCFDDIILKAFVKAIHHFRKHCRMHGYRKLKESIQSLIYNPQNINSGWSISFLICLRTPNLGLDNTVN